MFLIGLQIKGFEFLEARHGLRPMDLGARTPCNSCHALLWAWERTGLKKCCHNGAIEISPLIESPPLIKWLLKADPDDTARYPFRYAHFRDNIRKYNSALSFGTFSATVVPFRNGPPTYVVSGQLYRRIGPVARGGQAAVSMQVYFLDGDEIAEVDARLDAMPSAARNTVHRALMLALQAEIREVSPYVARFKDCLAETAGVLNARILIHADRAALPPGAHARQYNAPIANEIAAIQDFNNDPAVIRVSTTVPRSLDCSLLL
jgi:hypothetical protein